MPLVLRIGVTIAYWMLTLLPTIFLLLLLMVVWRASSLLGHLPIPTVDDPKFIEDSWFVGLYFPTILLFAFVRPLLPYIWVPFTSLMLWLSYRFGGSDRVKKTLWASLMYVAIYLLPGLIRQFKSEVHQRLIYLNRILQMAFYSQAIFLVFC
ncbi:hypothetical protein IQ254_18010 [Nodosilinea sp. LEGE 07088]|nr:hypothetical protein [Nodosilinea sp. LEGE 07088]